MRAQGPPKPWAGKHRALNREQCQQQAAAPAKKPTKKPSTTTKSGYTAAVPTTMISAGTLPSCASPARTAGQLRDL
jgi:hypothetical protein